MIRSFFGLLRRCVLGGGIAAMAAIVIAPAPAAAAIGVLRSATASTRAIVRAPAGRFTGFTAAGMRQFLGIPYAQPPVGTLRWRPPVPLGDSPSSVHAATAFGPHCPQLGGPFGEESTTEDCLYLNVYTPPRTVPNRPLPVMVWIHGGAFTTGESDDYDPDRLVPHGVVVVTINYRLGLLGFLAQSSLDSEGHPAVNYGLMDQQAALHWVRHNIASFGGDPQRTTIFGESAGGLSVFSQLSSPGAAGLFSAAIDESGSYQLVLPTLAQSEAAGAVTATELGCKAPVTAACLRAVPVTTLLATEGSQTVPTVDGTVLPLTPAVAFATGNFNRVPIIDGTNHDEYRLFVATEFDLVPGVGPITAQEYIPLIAASLGSAAAQAVVAEYPLSSYPSPDLAFATLVTDYIFACPALEADLSFAKFGLVYTYEFADENAPEPFLPPVSFPYGAAHASELQYLWDDAARPNPALSTAQQQLASTMTAYWTHFATTARPNDFSAPLWVPFFPQLLNMQTLAPPGAHPTFRFAVDHKCGFWQALASGQAVKSPSMQRIHDAVAGMHGLR